jgi:hypothetical protein
MDTLADRSIDRVVGSELSDRWHARLRAAVRSSPEVNARGAAAACSF